MIACFMPMFIMGLIPATIAMFTGDRTLLIVGLILTVTGAGDFLFLVKLRKEKGDDLVYDLPDEAGFIIYRKLENI